MAIIFEKDPGELIASTPMKFSTFPSSLIRVEQTFMCASGVADFWREQLSEGGIFPILGIVTTNTPKLPGGAVSDYRIFPDPQMTINQNGFTEFVVSAYSRTASSARVYFSPLMTFTGVLKSNDSFIVGASATGSSVRYFGYWSEYEITSGG